MLLGPSHPSLVRWDRRSPRPGRGCERRRAAGPPGGRSRACQVRIAPGPKRVRTRHGSRREQPPASAAGYPRGGWRYRRWRITWPAGGADWSGRADRGHQDPQAAGLRSGGTDHPLGAPPHFASPPALALGNPVQSCPGPIARPATPCLTAAAATGRHPANRTSPRTRASPVCECLLLRPLHRSINRDV